MQCDQIIASMLSGASDMALQQATRRATTQTDDCRLIAAALGAEQVSLAFWLVQKSDKPRLNRRVLKAILSA